MNIVSVFVSLLSVGALPSFLHKTDIRYSGQQFAILSRTFSSHTEHLWSWFMLVQKGDRLKTCFHKQEKSFHKWSIIVVDCFHPVPNSEFFSPLLQNIFGRVTDRMT